jgi:lipoate-protein ligase A
MTVCRLLPYVVADGPHNMAADEVILDAASAGVAALRFYGWCGPTVSLGYFQAERLREADPRLATLPFVRRPSGGAALVHHHEVTYALGLPPGQPWHSGESWLCRMHRIVSKALAALGVPSSICGASAPARFAGLLCFQHHTPGDLLLGATKVVGSAQRRHRGAFLQHGAVLLAASPYAPELPGIAELTGRAFEPDQVVRAVAASFVGETGWELRPVDWTDSEGDRIEELAGSKYARDAWNRKR